MNKLSKGLILSAVSLAIFTGCSSKSSTLKNAKIANTASPVVTGKVCKIPVNGKQVKAPEWVCNGGNIQGYITAVGSAPESNWGYSFQRNVALTQARAEIARQLQVKIKDMVTNFMSETGNKKAAQAVDGNLEQVTKSITSAMLVDSKLIDTWYAPNNTLFVLVAVPVDKNQIKQKTKKILKSSYKNEDALWQKFQSEQAEKKLDEAINKSFEKEVNPFTPDINGSTN